MQYIIIYDGEIKGLVENVNNAIQRGWEPLGGVATALESRTMKIPSLPKAGSGLRSIETKEVPAGVQTLYIQALTQK